MSAFSWYQDWLDIVADQEQQLRYSVFSRETALELGVKIVELIRQRGWGNAAIRIVENDTTIFAYKMAGTGDENDQWMNRKLALSRRARCSSHRAYVEAEVGMREAFWNVCPAHYAACGGCFPVFFADREHAWIYVLVSGLEHYQDHQVIADAMAWQLQKDIRSIC